MIKFILGEDRHVKYFVHAGQYEYFVIKNANWKLLYNGEAEAEGLCECNRVENGYELDAKIQPLQRSRHYEMEITIEVVDEIIKNKEAMEVI